MKLALALFTVLAVACGSKSKPAATPGNATGTSGGSAAGSAAQCCCGSIPNAQTAFLSPDECKAKGGTCEATEDSCHGIEGPIP